MNKRNTTIGVVLILLGISIYLRNFHISTGSMLTTFLGLGLLYTYYIKREEPFIIFGGIFTAIGLMSVLGDIRFFRIDMTFEAVLIVLGIIFTFIYYVKHIHGFIFPGMILPALGIYFILLRALSDRLASSSIFLLLGFAFYAIYFIAYMGRSSWPLMIASILLLMGILSYAFSLKVLTWNMVQLKWDYIWPLLMIAAGILLLLNRLKRRT
ncbi:MAG: hypothetical protein ACYCYE_15635 [Clostridia bacterium]